VTAIRPLGAASAGGAVFEPDQARCSAGTTNTGRLAW
jgi:hypothetical protein